MFKIYPMLFHGNFTLMKYDIKRGENMRKQLLLLLMVSLVLVGCSGQKYEPVTEKAFVATVNILEPSLSFFSATGEPLTTWQLDKAYTGATLVGDNVVLYGFGLDRAVAYALATGEKQYELKTGTGVTNVYYDDEQALTYVANGETNRIHLYSLTGEPLKQAQVGNYPMSMLVHDGELYSINYKDTVLTVLDAKQLTKKRQFTIDKSANGLLVPHNTTELWVGGHGEGAKPNTDVKRYDLQTGELLGKLPMPLMPIEFTQRNNEVYVVSHGRNTVYAVTTDGTPIWKQDVGANPFAIATLGETIFVAGYDDHTLYAIEDGTITKALDVQKGPFKLLVRED